MLALYLLTAATPAAAWTDEAADIFDGEACQTVKVLSIFSAPLYVRAMYGNLTQFAIEPLRSYRVDASGTEILDADFPTSLDASAGTTSALDTAEQQWQYPSRDWVRGPADAGGSRLRRRRRQLLAQTGLDADGCPAVATKDGQVVPIPDGTAALAAIGDADTDALLALKNELRWTMDQNALLAIKLCALSKASTATKAALDEVAATLLDLRARLAEGARKIRQLSERAHRQLDEFIEALNANARRGSAFHIYFASIVRAQYFEVDMLRRMRLARVHADRRTLLLDLARRGQSGRLGQMRLLQTASRALGDADPTCNAWLRLPDPVLKRWSIVTVHPGYALQTDTAPPGTSATEPAYVKMDTENRVWWQVQNRVTDLVEGATYYINQALLCETTLVATLSDVFYQVGAGARMIDYVVVSTEHTNCSVGPLPPQLFPRVAYDIDAFGFVAGVGIGGDLSGNLTDAYLEGRTAHPVFWTEHFSTTGVYIVSDTPEQATNRSMTRLLAALSVPPPELEYEYQLPITIDERWALLRQVDALPFDAGQALLRGTGRGSQPLMPDTTGTFPWRARMLGWSQSWTALTAADAHVPTGPALWFEGTLADLDPANGAPAPQLMYESFFSPITHGRALAEELALPVPELPVYAKWLLDHTAGRLLMACYGPPVWMAALSHQDQLSFDYWHPPGMTDQRTGEGALLNSATARPVTLGVVPPPSEQYPNGDEPAPTSVYIGYAPADWTLLPGESSAVRDYFHGYFSDGWIGTDGPQRIRRVFLAGSPLHAVDGHVLGGAAVYCGTANVQLLSTRAFVDQQALTQAWQPWTSPGTSGAQWPWELMAHETRALVRGYNWGFDGTTYNLYTNFSAFGVTLLDEHAEWRDLIANTSDRIHLAAADANRSFRDNYGDMETLAEFQNHTQAAYDALEDARKRVDDEFNNPKRRLVCSVFAPGHCPLATAMWLWAANIGVWVAFVGCSIYLICYGKAPPKNKGAGTDISKDPVQH